MARSYFETAPKMPPNYYEMRELLEEFRVPPEIKEVVQENPFIQKALLKLKEGKRPITLAHSLRIAEEINRTLTAVGFNEEDKELLVRSAFGHDVGKIDTPGEILFKTSRLSPAERKVMEKHPLGSFRIMEEIEPGRPENKIALRHHFFAKNYPPDLEEDPKSEELARIFSIFDIYESMSDLERPYNKKGKAWLEIEEELGVFNSLMERKIIEFLKGDFLGTSEKGKVIPFRKS